MIETVPASVVPLRGNSRFIVLSRIPVPVYTGISSFIVYVVTMFPGLAGLGDSPKFQFVGHVLGTPHAPGYPLYLLISWVFSQLPIGTLAYRINLMSGVFGALAVSLLTVLLRQLGCGPIPTAAVALAFGFGQVFWSQSIIAEVYTLNAVLFIAMWSRLIAWQQRRQNRDLLLAAGCYALGLAHHPTMWFTGPAVAGFVLLVDWRVVIRPRLIAAALALAAVGLSFYGLIWLRTVQEAWFLEARAESIADIFALLRGEQFSDWMFKFTWYEVATERIPLLLSFLGAELTAAGIALAATGTFLMWRSAPALAVGLLAVAVTITGFTVQHDAWDLEVFLILAMISLWIFAGVGLQWWLTTLRRLLPATESVQRAASAAVFALPLGLAVMNFDVNNHREHRFEAEYFDAFFEAMPNKTIVVEENFIVAAMVNYKIWGERAGNGPNLLQLPADAQAIKLYFDHGFGVVAFRDGKARLEEQGVTLEPLDWKLPFPRHGRHVLDANIEPLLSKIYKVRSIDPM